MAGHDVFLLNGMISAGFSALPLLLALAAIVDVVRTGSDWRWIPAILFFPVLGAIAYFASVRGGVLSPQRVAIQAARRTLRDRQPQLSHWRGPGPLTEVGEALLALGRYGEAEAHLREALATGAKNDDVAFPLGLALESQGKPADAVPFLEELCRKEPDHKFGQALLALARCLEAAGRVEDAERTLRQLVSRRSMPEARVRLARLLMVRGAREEADRILEALRREAEGMPAFQRRQESRWLRASRRLRPGRTTLPGAPKAGARDHRQRMATAVAVIGGAVVLALVVAQVILSARMQEAMTLLRPAIEEQQELRARLEALERSYPSPYPADPARVELTDEDVERFLRVSRRLQGIRGRGPGAEVSSVPAALPPVGVLGPLLALLRGGGMGAHARWLKEHNASLDLALDVLQAESMGPSTLVQLLDLVGNPGSLPSASVAVLDRRRQETVALDAGSARALRELLAGASD